MIKHLNNSRLITRRKQTFLTVLFPLLVAISTPSQSQDLLAGADLQDSPLSLSLTTSIPVTINNQTQHLVITQYGISNKATINQMANAANTVSISQEGNNNEADIMQSGYGNTVNIKQYGDNNLAGVVQDGDANIVNIWQAGEQHFTVHQIGNEMVVNITQY
jgi:minor curlin subunit